jgi:glycosyltransferase involved in cell wall biosynthesis
MKILQLCNKVPYPAKDGGTIAMLNLSKSFAKLGHEVTILAMNTPKHNTSMKEIPDELKKLIDFNLVFVDTRIRPFVLFMNLLFSEKPYNAIRFINNAFEQKLVGLLKSKEFDIIQLEGLYLVPYISTIKKYSSVTIALRAHNIESEIWSRIRSVTTNPLKRFYFGVISKRLDEFEENCLNKYDLLVPITERDAATYKGLGNNKPVKVISTGISKQNFKKSNENFSRKKLFFIGALDWIPNQEGLIWFMDKVWMKLIKKYSDLELHIAGRNAPNWFKKKCTEMGSIFHGEVDNAHKFMDANHIMIVPLFAGSGMRIKIIEAMARSKVVVTTSIGAEGLGVENETHIIIGNNENEFISGIIQLIKEDEFFGKIRENAFVYTQQNFNNKQLTIELLEFYKNHLAC